MKRLTITNIATLYGCYTTSPVLLCGRAMADVGHLHDAYLTVDENGCFETFGPMQSLPQSARSASDVVDARGGCVFPSWCDPHSHIVYAGSREGEFVDKIRGLSYAEIAQRGGGILNSADRLHNTSEDDLFAQAMVRVRELERKGTGALEIKSGYGLNTADEMKMLRVIARIMASTLMTVKCTFLGAHAVGRAYQGRQQDYVDMLVAEMLPQSAEWADYVDVFCDKGFFTPQQTAQILDAAARYGLRGKIHGQELADSGGVQVAVHHGALSVDHLESATTADIALLRRAHGIDKPLADEHNLSPVIPTALPGTSFFLNMPYAPARNIIDAGLPLAIASDYNPGSTPSGDMKFVMSLACIKLRLLPQEAFNAATVNAAYAMGVENRCGSITPGLKANFFITEPISGLDFVPYAYTTPLVRCAYLQGRAVE